MSGALWESEVEQQVKAAVQLGAQANFEHALQRWKVALSMAQGDASKADLLMGRSKCYVDYSAHLRSIPAAASECAAQFALEPQQLAELGLTDAKRAAELQAEQPEAFVRVARAQLALEDYGAAESAALHALSLDADSDGAQEALRAAKAAKGVRPRRSMQTLEEDFDCTLCCKLLYKPVTTPCGHTFCKACFSRSVDHCNKCPMCRRVLHAGRELPVTVVLANLLQQAFPEETERRRRECSAAGGSAPADGDGSAMDTAWTLPVFVMSSMLPGESVALNIFEPRYRLMFRRCLEGNRRLCMTCALQARRPNAQDRAAQHFLPDVMTECAIRECTVQPDGRLSVQCVGVRRVHTTGDSEQDGYRVCVIDREIKDVPLAVADGAAAAPLPPQLQLLKANADRIIADITGKAESAPRPVRAAVLAHVAELGPAPEPAADPERLTWWAALMLGVREAEKLKMLGMVCTEERARLLNAKICSPSQAADGIVRLIADGEGCCVM